MTIKTKLTIWSVIFIIAILGGVFYYLIYAGIIKIGADAVVGCQNTKMISAFFGRPGTNLVSYNFFGQDISINSKMMPFLDKVQNEIKSSKIKYDFKNVTSYNNRSKRGGGGKSLHSWGIAIDINPETNPQHGGTDMPASMIDIFRKHGFFWGGDWGGRDTDPMHFEWYGASMEGQFIDNKSKQRVKEVASEIDGSGSPNKDGLFYWVVPYGNHTIKVIGRGYKENEFTVDLTCFTQQDMNIDIEALPENTPGSLAGKVKVTGNYPLLLPANIYLDGKAVGVANIKGDYYIPDVRQGEHKVEAKIMNFPGGSVTVKVLPGDNLKNININIGK